MHASMGYRDFGKPVRRCGLAGAPVLRVVFAVMLTWGAINARAAEVVAEGDVIQSVVGISAIIPKDARTAEHLGVLRSGSGVVIDDDGLVLTIGYLMMEAEQAAVTDAEGKLVPAVPVAYDHKTGFGLLRATLPLGLSDPTRTDASTLPVTASSTATHSSVPSDSPKMIHASRAT